MALKPLTLPRRFTAMRYFYLCLIDCIGGGLQNVTRDCVSCANPGKGKCEKASVGSTVLNYNELTYTSLLDQLLQRANATAEK